MMFESSWPYILGFLAGVSLGIFYYGGLWLTVKKVPISRNPQILLLLSAVLRLVPTLFALFIAVKINPGIFLVMLPGFFGVRYMMIRRISNLSRGEAHATYSRQYCYF